MDHRTEHEACAALEDAVRERWPKELLARHRRSPAHLQPFVGRTIDSVDLGGDGIAIVSGDAQFKCLRLPDVHVGGVRLRPKSEEWFLALWGLIGGCVDAFEERGALVAMDVSGTEVVVDTEDPEHDSVEYALVWGPDGGLSVY